MSATRWKSLTAFANYLDDSCKNGLEANKLGLRWKIGNQSR